MNCGAIDLKNTVFNNLTVRATHAMDSFDHLLKQLVISDQTKG